MTKELTIKYWQMLLTIILSVSIPSISFVITTVVMGKQVDINTETLKNKVDNPTLAQYMKLLEERYKLESMARGKNEKEHHEILEKLKEVEIKISRLEVQVIGYETYRSKKKSWDYDLAYDFLADYVYKTR